MRRSSPCPVRQLRRQIGLEREVLASGQRLERDDHAVDDLLERIVGERQAELPGLDLGQVEHIVDEPEQVSAIGLDALEHLAHPVGGLAVDVVENELGVAENGIQRRAQLVAHIGEELGFVPAFDLELAALLADLAEQARVLDGQHRLGGEGLEQVGGALRKASRLLAAHDQKADDVAGAAATV